MAELNFNALIPEGPRGFYQGFEQGQTQRAEQQNQLARQQSEMQAQQFNALKMQGYQEDRASKLRAEKAALFRDSILRAPDPNTAREVIKRQYADPDIGPFLQRTIPLDAALSEISNDPVQFKQYQDREALGAENYVKSQLPKVAGNAVYDPKTNSFVTAPREFAPLAPTMPVAVMGANGKPQYVNREDAIGMTPFSPATIKFMGGGAGAGAGAGAAPAGKPLTEAQTIKLRETIGKDYKAASTALSQIDDLLASANAVKTAPGLSAATGYMGKYLPSFSEGPAAQAETRLANLRGKVTALGKATASMGGAIGSIATQEWRILADQIAVLDEVKGKKPLLDQIELLETQAKGAADRIRDAYEKTRGDDFDRFPQFRDLPKQKPPANTPPAASAPNVVVTPDGQSHVFPTPAAAAQFKKAAGIP